MDRSLLPLFLLLAIGLVWAARGLPYAETILLGTFGALLWRLRSTPRSTPLFKKISKTY
jgi:hypothetical protein